MIPAVTNLPTVQVLSADERVVHAARALPKGSYVVAFSNDMEEFLEAVGSQGCDVAVIDLALNGYAAGVELKGLSLASRVVMLCDRPHDRWLCRQAGADEVLVKPLEDPAELIAAVTALSV